MSNTCQTPIRPAPVVLLPACNRQRPGRTTHQVGGEYVEAVRSAGCRPLAVPYALPDEIDAWLDDVDGVLLTGSPSNVGASLYGQATLDPALPSDPLRDGWTLPLVQRALARGVPLLAVCRGFQEANVALGGSLHQAVHQVPGMADHREPASADIEAQYAPAHTVQVEAGGLLASWFGATTLQVNSLHGQGVDRLALGLRCEARAPDGLVEAFSAPGASAFNLAVQWHPEWAARTDPVSMRLFAAFGQACRARQAERLAG